MKYRIIFLIVVAFSLVKFDTAYGQNVSINAPNITADAAILIDGRTGQVLYEKNSQQKCPPASTTKIMTAIIALEGGNLETLVSVSPKAAAIGESSIHLTPYEKLTLNDLLYGAMLRSGNDACVAIAEHIAGSEDMFVNFMNHHAKILGGYNTHFCNTNGLPNDLHHSSAYDLAMFAKYAMTNEKFCDIVRTRQRVIANADGMDRYLRNTNKLLWSYSWVDGIKTGTTNAAGCCLVTSANKEGRHLIAVVLHSDDRYGDTLKLLNYGLENFEEVVVLTKGEHFTTVRVEDGYHQTVPIVAAESMNILVPKWDKGTFEQRLTLERQMVAPVRAHCKVGEVTVNVNDREVGRVDLITASAVTKLPKHLLIYQRMCDYL
ncbi:D-alanyl-D-alanine carboxypeptidase family protein [Peptococcaceae bacterium 1198_IL3148]